jgi:hypothetical protein
MEYNGASHGRVNRVRELLGEFPGPVVDAAQPAPGWRAFWGGELSNGVHHHKAHVRYRSGTDAPVLSLHTVRPEQVPPPVIGTIESMAGTLLEMRMAAARPSGRGHRSPTVEEFRALADAATRDEATAPDRPYVIRIDEAEVSGRRKDFADCSAIEVNWNAGIRIFGIGDTAVIDRLSLRSLPGIP